MAVMFNWRSKKRGARRVFLFGRRGLVEITVMLPRDPQATEEPSADEQSMRHGFGERICRELRAYLLIGR